ncbi:hypothetical protein C8R48DRAFT_689202 [Suillus tomentosus]|nr:hypothetical protein C8R48DRAFT_689202 [Suillus tomentosus]
MSIHAAVREDCWFPGSVRLPLALPCSKFYQEDVTARGPLCSVGRTERLSMAVQVFFYICGRHHHTEWRQLNRHTSCKVNIHSNRRVPVI